MNALGRSHLTAIAGDAAGAACRYIVPIRALIENDRVTGNVSIDSLPTPNPVRPSAIVLSARARLAPDIAAAAKRDGLRLVLDFDGLPSASHPAVDRLLADADEVTVSTQPLAQALSRSGRDPHVLAFTLDPRDWRVKPRRVERARPRVGWYGSRRGLEHLAELCDTVCRALMHEIDFVFFERIPDTLSDCSERFECATAVPLSLFPAQFAALDLDIVLTPLVHDNVSECSSNLPLLQAGILGYPVIATDIAPYTGLPVSRVENVARTWIAALRDRVHENTALRREGETLRTAVERDFLVQGWMQRYFERWAGRRVAAGIV